MRRTCSLATAFVVVLLCVSLVDARGLRREYREGRLEIRRERAEMMRDIYNSNNRWQARQAYREGMREIRRERRVMRREMRREWRRQQFHTPW